MSLGSNHVAFERARAASRTSGPEFFDPSRLLGGRCSCAVVCRDGDIDDLLNVLFGDNVVAQAVDDMLDVLDTGPEALPTPSASDAERFGRHSRTFRVFDGDSLRLVARAFNLSAFQSPLLILRKEHPRWGGPLFWV